MIPSPQIQELAPIPTVEQLVQRVSASRLQTFHQCRLKFFFRYVACIQKPKHLALHVGSAVHHALQEWNRSRWFSRNLGLERVRESFSRFWAEEQESAPVDGARDHSPDEEREAAWELVQMYLDNPATPHNEKPEAVEVSVEADLRKHGLPVLNGFIDLVRPTGRIVDYKTTAQTPNHEKAAHLHELQLSCYGLLYRDATGRKESGFELHHLVKMKTPKLMAVEVGAITEAQQTRLFRAIESFMDGVSREDRVPNPNPMTCACCEFFAECRSWTGEREYGCQTSASHQ